MRFRCHRRTGSEGSRSRASKKEKGKGISKFIFFSGKGGVGKTTCAAARALAESRTASRTTSRKTARVLIVSTDPAHSLGDALGVSLGPTPRRVTRGLDAVELDAPRAFRRWIAEHRRALSQALEHGTWLDRADIAALLDLTIPGVDELVGLVEIARLAQGSMARRRRDPDPYDVVVVDTAPTGHTLRLLAAPETVAAMAGVLDALQEDHRFIRERIAGSLRAEDADRLIALIAQQAADVGSMLRDPRRASFHWVTLPERLSVAEAADGIAALTAAGIAVGHIDVDRVLPDDDPCLLCDRRRREERQVLAAIRRGIGRGRRVGVVPAQATEPRGIAALERLASAASPLSAVRPNRSGSRAGSAAATVRPPVRGRSPIGEALSGAALVFVGGKGGVGKTTVAASIALTLARAASRRSVLLLSTDPAHSLADVLDAPVGDDAAPVRGAPPNLVVRELDAPRALASKRASLQTALDEIGVSLGGSSVSADPLIELAPPGIDELFGMLSVVDALAAHHTVVIDTAPTGHALRLLEMPDAAREWVQLLLRVLLKYKSLVRPGRLARELVEASQSIRALQSIMRDPVRTRFVVVTRAAAVTRAETGRLFLRLRALGLTTRAVVVNAMTMAPGRCRRCTATAAAERRELTALKALARKARLRDCAIIQTPLVAPPPRGPAALSAWPRTWVASEP